MPVSRTLVPEGAPAQLFEYIKKNPGKTVGEAIEIYGMPISVAYYALARLRDLNLIRRVSRKLPVRWEAVAVEIEPAPAPVPLVVGHPWRPTRVFSSQPVYRWTGVRISDAKQILRIEINGAPQKPEPNHPGRPGSAGHRTDPNHPFSFVNRHRRTD
jgi:hypothetical protein